MKRNLIVLLTILVSGLRSDCLQAGTKERGRYGKRNEAED